MKLRYSTLPGDAVRCVRSSAPLGREWKEKIEADFKSRKPRT